MNIIENGCKPKNNASKTRVLQLFHIKTLHRTPHPRILFQNLDPSPQLRKKRSKSAPRETSATSENLNLPQKWGFDDQKKIIEKTNRHIFKKL